MRQTPSDVKFGLRGKFGLRVGKPELLERLQRIPGGVFLSLIYVFFGIGALWSSTGVLQDIMKSTMPFVFAAVALLTVWWTYEFSNKLFGALCIIVAVTWAVEALGMATTFPFGAFAYTDALGLRLLEVPVAKPFLWLLIIAASDAVVGHFFGRLSCVIAALFAMVLDFFLEVAANALDLWHWSTPFPPLSNYASWFVISLAAMLLLRDDAVRKVQLQFPAHIYVALMLFFAITFLGVKSGLLRLY